MSMLQRRAFGEGKTTSKKAKVKASSQASSRATSRAGSRVGSAVPSRMNSDVGSDSEGSVFSFGSTMDELKNIEEMQAMHKTDWVEELGQTIAKITDRRKTGFEAREANLLAYNRMLLAVYSLEGIEGRSNEIYDALLKSLKSGKTEREQLLAVKAIALTIVTDPKVDIFPTVSQTLKQVVIDNTSEPLKALCIHTLALAAFYGGASVSVTEALMNFLQDIIDSDGGSVTAEDSSTVVAAAIQAWGYLFTTLDDTEEITQAAITTFVDQLDSSEVDVQVAAGEVIALLYEKSYTEADESDDEDIVEFKNPGGLGGWVKRYEVYPRTSVLVETLNGLSSGAKKYLSKKDRKTQHSTFNDVLHTVENPVYGPRYSEALDEEGRKKGSRMTVKTHRDESITVDRWWKLIRLGGMKRLLGGGWFVHWTMNPNIRSAI